MSLANYGQLKAAVADWATKPGLVAKVPDFVAWAHEEICRRLRAPVLYARADVAVNGETVATPAGFLAVKRFYLDLATRRPLHLTDSARLMDISAEHPRCAYPTHFAVEGIDTFVFAPLFSTAATGKLLYYKAPAALVSDADSNVVLARYPFLYLFGALEALFAYMEDDAGSNGYGARFGALLASINDEEAKDATRGPLIGSPGTAVV